MGGDEARKLPETLCCLVSCISSLSVWLIRGSASCPARVTDSDRLQSRCPRLSATEMATVSRDDRGREDFSALFQSLPATELSSPQLAYFSKSPVLRDRDETGASLDESSAKFCSSCPKLGGFFSSINAHRRLCTFSQRLQTRNYVFDMLF